MTSVTPRFGWKSFSDLTVHILHTSLDQTNPFKFKMKHYKRDTHSLKLVESKEDPKRVKDFLYLKPQIQRNFFFLIFLVLCSVLISHD